MSEEPEPEFGEVKTLGTHVRTAWARVRADRPASVYLIMALFLMLLLGTQMIDARNDPYRFALFLALHFVFLFVLIVRALFDMAEIAKDHFKERERVFRATLGDPEFAQRLGRRVSEERDRRPSIERNG